MNDKPIMDITPFTQMDYPEKLACIVWFRGCNMRCIYCYNSDIVFAKKGNYSTNDLLDFLKTRIGLLDGVVLSGGEATLYDLLPLCKEIKKMGFLIKLDTNGLNPEKLMELVNNRVIDYVALDYKARNTKFGYITGSSRFKAFTKSLDFLISSKMDFEVRTTVHADLLNADDINLMMKDLKEKGYDKPYYLQKFIKTENTIGNIEAPASAFAVESLCDTLEVIWR